MNTNLNAIIIVIGTLFLFPELGKSAENSRPLSRKRENYVNKWIEFKKFNGVEVKSGKRKTFTPKYGEIEFLFFLASWNINSLKIIEKISWLEQKYKSKGVQFYYAFSHDTRHEIKKFVKEFNLKGISLIADQKLLNAHFQPIIPTVILSDKNNWICFRESKVKLETIEKIDDFLKLLTVL